MTTFYAASHLNERFADTGNTARRVRAFNSAAERDAWVANSPTDSLLVNTTRIPLRADELGRGERLSAQFHMEG